ncbi:MAG: HdeD family acid-resistance protein [Methanoregulaceae archaeon]
MTDEVTIPKPELPVDVRAFPWWLILLWGILSIIIGVMFLTTPAITTVVFITLLGAFWLVGGVFTLASLVSDKSNMGWKILIAILNILVGIIILAYPLYSTLLLLAFFIIFLGFWACIIGALHLFQAFTMKDAGMGVLGIISLFFGILLLAFPLISIELVPFVAGAFAFVLGICAIIFAFSARKAPEVPAP